MNYYRWVIINNQETCYTCVVKVLEGYFKDEDAVKDHYAHYFNFKECLYGVKKLDFTETPEWLLKKLTSTV